MNLIWLSWEVRQGCPGITPLEAQKSADRILEHAQSILMLLTWGSYSVHDIYIQLDRGEY